MGILQFDSVLMLTTEFTRTPRVPSSLLMICLHSSQSSGKHLTCLFLKKDVTSNQMRGPGCRGFFPWSLGHNPLCHVDAFTCPGTF